MFELIIKYANGSVYWVERFQTQTELENWLASERTRPYWKSEFTTETVDHTPPPPTQQEIDDATQRRQAIALLKARVKALAAQSDLTAAEVKEAIMKFIKLHLLLSSLD